MELKSHLIGKLEAIFIRVKLGFTFIKLTILNNLLSNHSNSSHKGLNGLDKITFFLILLIKIIHLNVNLKRVGAIFIVIFFFVFHLFFLFLCHNRRFFLLYTSCRFFVVIRDFRLYFSFKVIVVIFAFRRYGYSLVTKYVTDKLFFFLG